MSLSVPLGISVPVLFINPLINRDVSLVEEVSRAGGLGIVDHVAGDAPFLQVAAGIPYGIRIPLDEMSDCIPSPDLRAIVIPLEDIKKVLDLEPDHLKNAPAPVIVEVGTGMHALGVQKIGAAGVIARGNEGPGWVSQTNGFVLLQEILATCSIPVFLRGGVTFRTAAGAVAAGATGIVLDVLLLLIEGSRIDQGLRAFLRSLNVPSTIILGDGGGCPLRVYSRVGTKTGRHFRKTEDSINGGDWPSHYAALSNAMRQPCLRPDTEECLLPMSEDLLIERDKILGLGTATAVVGEFAGRMFHAAGPWPFNEDSEICRMHGTRFPIVQGPMAHVSDSADFLETVGDAGALPFLAMGNMPPRVAAEALRSAAARTQGRFGVGLIGLEVNRRCYEAHMELMRETPPSFAILAAGSPDLAMEIEAQGTVCYLHCPSPALLSQAISMGLKHFVFEGCESGGHIGALGSLNLWSANLGILEAESEKDLDLSKVSVLFAGGIGSAYGSAFLGGIVSDLAAKGLRVGIQMGTAYLACHEAVSCGAITSTYHTLALEADSTVVIGRTVNTRARAAGSPMAQKLIEREWDRVRLGITMGERKALYEKDNLGALRLASKGYAIDPETAASDCPVFCEMTPEQQSQGGLYLMGQAVSLLGKPNTVSDLHAEIIEEGQRIFEKAQCLLPASFPSEQERPKNAAPIAVYMDCEPIAVVGIGLRFPGADSPRTYWEQILAGRSGIGPVPEERWGQVDYYYDPDPTVPDKSYTKIGGFIRDFCFDPLSYRIPPSVAKHMDRTQQLAVSCTADALRDAGLSLDKLRGARVGVILGNSMGGENTDRYAERVGLSRVEECLSRAIASLQLDPATRGAVVDEFRSSYLADLPDITEDSLPGELANIISGRVANVFNLEGPNFTVDAACASSIAAVMNSVSALRDGSIDYAVTGGVDAAMHPSSFVKFCKIGALSADGSRPFDSGANGFVMGEGAGIMILKRLSDALRDRDRVYGVIVGIGSSSDGKGKGITAPNLAGQVRAVRKCYDSGIDPASIGLIEGHGTSTAVGDTTELTALDGFFREVGLSMGSIGLGSVKSQIGHLKAASGAAGMIKALLGLYHRTLPPTINVREPNPCIDWNSSPLFLLTQAREWTRTNGFPRRAGVSAFGFGGTNFHLVLQEFGSDLHVIKGRKRPLSNIQLSPPEWPFPPELSVDGEAWVLGGSDPLDLAGKIRTILKELRPSTWRMIAAETRREALHAGVRCGFAAADCDGAIQKMQLVLEGLDNESKRPFLQARGIHVCQGEPTRANGGTAFLFPGQGSQYPFMLRDLAQRFPIVSRTFSEADEVLLGLGLPSITSTLFPEGAEHQSSQTKIDPLRDTQVLQPLILTANTALFRLLALMGIRPLAVAGHSLGEYAACVAAEVFSFPEALEAVSVRGREMARVSIADPGLMMSIPADARIVEDVLAQVDGYVVAANKNSPKQTVISGETEAVRKAGELFKEQGLEGVLIPVSAAFHSGVVAPAREPFMKTLEKLTVNPPTIPVLSNVTGEFYPVGPSAPGRIRDLLGKQFAAPVEWVKSLRRLHGEGIRIFVECGPKRVLTNFTVDTLPQDILAMPTNHPRKGGVLQLMETLAALAVEGIPVDFDAAEAPQADRLEECPPTKPTLKKASVELPRRPRGNGPSVRTPEPLDRIADDEIREMAQRKEFARFLETQGEPIRALIKTGFTSFLKNFVPLEETVRHVTSEGMDFQPVAVSGISAGLPNDVRFPFDRDSLDDLIMGRNFIKQVSRSGRESMLEKNVERLFKGPSGEAELQAVEDISGVIQLAGFFSESDIVDHYGLDSRLVGAMDITTRLAVAAGIEALKDAGIPLMQSTRVTSTGQELPDSWALPPKLRNETGVIFASAFPGMASLVDEVTREAASRYGSGARKRLIEFYTGLVAKIRDDAERERITGWFTEEFGRLSGADKDELYTFNRSFLLKVMSMAHGQLAQLIKAQGPNTHVDAACAGTTQALLVARDWIRTGQANRVIVVAADDVAGSTLLPWIGSGFLAMGAATTNGTVSEAALPFDDRRHGLILGSAAVGMVLEKADLVRGRGMDGIATIEGGVIANSGFHGTRLDVDHICSVMEHMISKWEAKTGLSRDQLAREAFFMSHETYSPKRGGSSSAEIAALRKTFGDTAAKIPIVNTKGFTGHTMGVGVEDVVAIRCLQKSLIPPIPNLRQPDPEFADMNLSKGGACDARYALRLAAGFGSQIVMALYKVMSREDNRMVDLPAHRAWLADVTGIADPVLSVDHRTLRVTRSRKAFDDPVTASPVHSGEEAGSAGMPVPVSENLAHGLDEVKPVILDLLSEKTGYPSEMLDTKLDLEADLGIDTVKQAEFISQVRERFGIPRIERLKIAEFPTIDHIIEFVAHHVGQSATLKDGASKSSEKHATSYQYQDEDTGICSQILSLLSQKTGYPEDMLDPRLDLEADLGIDTVKQAEFISEVRELFGIPRIEGLKIADFPTIEHVVGFVRDRVSEHTTREELTTEIGTRQPTVQRGPDIGVFEARVVKFAPAQFNGLIDVDRTIIVGGPSHITACLQSLLSSRGCPDVQVVRGSEFVAQPTKDRTGIVNLLPLAHSDDSPKESFEMYLTIAASFDDGPQFLVNAVSEDGAYGFEYPTAEGWKAGAVAGAAKAFAKEYPRTLVRVLDVHPNLDPEEVAAHIVNSISESFPIETGLGKDGFLRLVRFVPLVDEFLETGIHPGDVVLVTGGARGITAACLLELAADRSLTFVILGRTAFSRRAEQLANFGSQQWSEEKQRITNQMRRQGTSPTPVMVDKELSLLKAEAEAYHTIRQLRQLGAEVIYRSVDICDELSVDAVIKEAGELCSRVDVVIHGAGIDTSKALKSKTLEQIERVMSVKVDGMRFVLRSLEKHQVAPRRVIAFGSVSGRFGNLAQLDYCAANDSLAHLLRYADSVTDAKVSIIDWAPWADIGMAVRGSARQILETAGIDFIPPHRGAEILMREINRATGSCEILAAGRLGPFEEDAFALPPSDPEIDTSRDEIICAGQKVRIISSMPGEYLKAEVCLSPTHPLLDHHRIDRAAVLPGVGGIQIMRSLAQRLTPETDNARLEQVRFHSPLKIFKNEPAHATVELIRLYDGESGSARFRARISSRILDRKGQNIGPPRLHHECVLVTADSKQEIGENPFPLYWEKSLFIAEKDIYKVFFHGPGFRFLDHVSLSVEERGIRFRFRDTMDRPSMFSDYTAPAIEASFQAAAAFGMEAFGLLALPVGVGIIEACSTGDIPYDGFLSWKSEKSVEAFEGRREFTFDGVVTNSAGTIILRMRDIRLVEFQSGQGFPSRVSETVLPVGEFTQDLSSGCEQAWKEALSEEEIQEHQSRKTVKRAAEWLTGRIASKTSVQSLIAASGAEHQEARTIRIVKDAQGKPSAELADKPVVFENLTLSHSHGLAIAAAADSEAFAGIGIDVEKPRPRSEAWVRDYFTEEEISTAGQDDRRWERLTMMWCLKEAVLKALGTGLRLDLKSVSVKSINSSGRAELVLRNGSSGMIATKNASEIEARVEPRDGLVLARVLIRK